MPTTAALLLTVGYYIHLLTSACILLSRPRQALALVAASLAICVAGMLVAVIAQEQPLGTLALLLVFVRTLSMNFDYISALVAQHTARREHTLRIEGDLCAISFQRRPHPRYRHRPLALPCPLALSRFPLLSLAVLSKA